MNPDVSVIVPVYNVEKYLNQCITSLLKQTLTNIEIILVDDGSTDSSGRLCDQFGSLDKRIKVLHKNNEGLGMARNSGVSIATGKYIGFVDSDDFVSSKMFEVLYNNAEKYSADASYCEKVRFYDGDRFEEKEKTENKKIEVYTERQMSDYVLHRIGMPPESEKDTLYQTAVWLGIYRKTIIDEKSIEFVSERKLISEDIIFNIDFFLNCGKVIHCHQPLYYYRDNSNSLTKTYRADRFERNVLMYQELCTKLKSVFPYTNYKDSVDRYLITYARIACMQEIEFINSNGFIKAKNNIKIICDSPELKCVLSEYQYQKMPIKYRIIANCQKYKWISLLMLILLIKNNEHKERRNE